MSNISIADVTALAREVIRAQQTPQDGYRLVDKILSEHGGLPSRSKIKDLPPERLAAVRDAFKVILKVDEASIAAELAAETEAAKKKGDAAVLDYYFYAPEGNYLYAPKAELRPKQTVGMLGKKLKEQIDARKIEGWVWSPADPQIIKNKIALDGGWIDKDGADTFNRFRPSSYVLGTGNADNVKPWRDHIRTLYSEDDALHIEQYLAHKAQHPGGKINHALVLGGATRIGKDTIVEPMETALGEWNLKEVAAGQTMDDRNNGFLETVMLRISEARDFGEKNRYSFYERMKPWLASPPKVLSVADKWIKLHPVFNVAGVIITTNYKVRGIYLPPDDARHYVAWSDFTKEDFGTPEAYDKYFAALYFWYEFEGGYANVSEWLMRRDLSDFNPKAPPPLTEAWHQIVSANMPAESAELTNLFEQMGNPNAVTVKQVIHAAATGDGALEWVNAGKRNQIPGQMTDAGYVSVNNPSRRDGLWKVGGSACVIYARDKLTADQRVKAAKMLAEDPAA